jgi:type I restriction enzyme R subunit
MNKVGSIERITQNRVVKLFQEELGYTYLGDWQEDRENSNIEEEYLTKYLLKKGYNNAQIIKAIYELKTTTNNFSDSLYLLMRIKS